MRLLRSTCKGNQKVAAELLIKDKCQNFAILRSSIIFGPQTLSPLPKTDSPNSDDKQKRLVLNAGGPERLSRVQMAQMVAEVRGHDLSLIKHASASSGCVQLAPMISNIADQSPNASQLFSQVDRGTVSPADNIYGHN